jgi:hypothetical protein
MSALFASSEIELRRARWEHHRASMQLTDTSGDQFALGGLAAHSEAPDVRLVVLPADPQLHPVPLDASTAAWLSESRPSPYDGQQISWGDGLRATSQALVLGAVYRDQAPWRRYLALHRHGGLEAATARVSWQRKDQGLRVFSLRHIVGLAWTAFDLQAGAAQRWNIDGPWEVTLALRSCGGAALGGFAEGWLEPDDFRSDNRAALEQHALHRWEVDAIEPEELAEQIAHRTENTFGSTHRRHLANRGQFDGTFDPRFGW